MKEYTYDERNFKQKCKDRYNTVKLKAGIKAREAKEFCKNNKEAVIGIAAVSIPGLIKLGGKAMNNRKFKMEEKRRDRDYWDPRTGKHWVAKKKVSTKTQLEIERRYKNGEDYGEILNSLNLL